VPCLNSSFVFFFLKIKFDNIIFLAFLRGNNTLMGFPVLKPRKPFSILEKNKLLQKTFICTRLFLCLLNIIIAKKWIFFSMQVPYSLDYLFRRYPMSLYFLDLLQYEHFRREVVNSHCTRFIDDQQVLLWHHYTRRRTKLVQSQEAIAGGTAGSVVASSSTPPTSNASTPPCPTNRQQ